jgi:hypothetical protein
MSTVPISSPKGTVIVFHGNAGSAAGREFYVQALAPLGYRVIHLLTWIWWKKRNAWGDRIFQGCKRDCASRIRTIWKTSFPVGRVSRLRSGGGCR